MQPMLLLLKYQISCAGSFNILDRMQFIYCIFADIDDMKAFPDDFDEMRSRNDSARDRRRRNRYPSSPRVILFLLPHRGSDRQTFLT